MTTIVITVEDEIAERWNCVLAAYTKLMQTPGIKVNMSAAAGCLLIGIEGVEEQIQPSIER